MSEALNPNSVDALLADFEAPSTFTINLPGDRVWTIKGLGTYAEKRRYDQAKEKWVSDIVSQHNAYLKSSDLNAIAIPAFRDHVNVLDRANLEAAYDLANRVIEPKFDYVGALRLCAAPALVAVFVDQLTYGSAMFLIRLKAELLESAGKDSSATP